METVLETGSLDARVSRIRTRSIIAVTDVQLQQMMCSAGAISYFTCTWTFIMQRHSLLLLLLLHPNRLLRMRFLTLVS